MKKWVLYDGHPVSPIEVEEICRRQDSSYWDMTREGRVLENKENGCRYKCQMIEGKLVWVIMCRYWRYE